MIDIIFVKKNCCHKLGTFLNTINRTFRWKIYQNEWKEFLFENEPYKLLQFDVKSTLWKQKSD